tara:strand:- start:2857 stop:3321 length:465 start_codon:yes stop_codon:yes gene_type:complete
MAVEHSTLTTTDLHEPKGVAAANADEIYVANGSASGAWSAHDNVVYLFTTIADISTASSSWVACPIPGTIVKIYTIIDAVIASANAIITAEINTTAVTNSSITIAYSGSAVGDVDSSSPTGARTVAVGDKIEIITNGGSTNTCKAVVTICITPS